MISKTQSAIAARKYAVEVLGLDPHISYRAAACAFILEKNLYVKLPGTRDEAIAFFNSYQQLSKFQVIKPIPDGITRGRLFATCPAKAAV